MSPKMFQTTCDQCGNSCEVPFLPSSGKPIYCQDCFKANRPKSNKGQDTKDRYHESDRPMHSATCDSCGQQCQVPFKPSSGKPVYCSNCFKKDSTPRRSSGGGQDIEKRLEFLEKKIDKILDLLQS